ncbi:MAG: hypothetical protein HC892_08610 [Saprospiraceae bacterium]|nr:hypothetical protein [Saprospiraceae bacterium]
MDNNKKKYLDIIQKGVTLLQEDIETTYTQRRIVEKLEAIGNRVSTSFLNKAFNGKSDYHFSLAALRDVANAVKKIIKSELNMIYSEKSSEYVKDIDDSAWTKIIIEPPQPKYKPTLQIFRDGRLPVSEKAAYLDKAQKEVIIFGTRLNQFANYFSARSEAEYKTHVLAALKRGVDFHCYLINPNGQSSKFYFDDLKKVAPKEAKSISIIQDVIAELTSLQSDFDAKGYKGKLHLYTYDHLPTYHLLALDANTAQGKMQVSHYLYGVKRSDCPVIAFEQQTEPELFKKYWLSFNALRKDARQLLP